MYRITLLKHDGDVLGFYRAGDLRLHWTAQWTTDPNLATTWRDRAGAAAALGRLHAENQLWIMRMRIEGDADGQEP